MSGYEAPHTSIVDLHASEWFDQNLLVLTDPGGFGHDALGLPFRDAMVVETNGEDSEVEVSFDTVVVDRRLFDPASVAAAIACAARVLRSGGRILVAFPPASGDTATDAGARAMATSVMPEPEVFARIAWRGVGYLNGRLWAILAPADSFTGPPAQIATLLVTAHTSFRLGVDQIGQAYAETRHRLDYTQASLVQHIEARRRSEQALLRHLELVVQQLNEERRRHRGRALIRTALERHKAGRVLIRVIRPIWRLLRKVRHRTAPLRRRLASVRHRLTSERP